MKVLVSGSSGLIGSALVGQFKSRGIEIARLVRSYSHEPERQIHWDPAGGIIDESSLEGFDAVVHLAGENVASGRWTLAKKREIRESRVKGANLLSEALAACRNPPKVLVSASAIGYYYGNRGDEILTEESLPGSSFLSEVCRDSEAACSPCVARGIRVVNLRIGMVLAPKGGALAMMLPSFLMGGGGHVGSGGQYVSWISMDDVIGATYHALISEGLSGPVNAVAPNPVTNLEFTRILGHVLNRPTIFSLPEFVARMVFGELADQLLLVSARVEPAKLLARGYVFQHPDLEGALRDVLARPTQTHPGS